MPRRAPDLGAEMGCPEDRTSRRFWSKVNIRSADECWEWQRATRNGGYGTFAIWPGHFAVASRLAWIFHNGRPIPDGLKVRHDCDNPPCCNPGHLRLGTQGDNVQDMLARGRGRYQRKKSMT